MQIQIHFIVINDDAIVSNSSAAHHIPTSSKANGSLHIVAPGCSDNFEFEMLFYHEDGECPSANLTAEQIEQGRRERAEQAVRRETDPIDRLAQGRAQAIINQRALSTQPVQTRGEFQATSQVAGSVVEPVRRMGAPTPLGIFFTL